MLHKSHRIRFTDLQPLFYANVEEIVVPLLSKPKVNNMQVGNLVIISL